MKRAFLGLMMMLLCLAWATAYAEDDGRPQRTDCFDGERFSIVEEGERRFLRYEQKSDSGWETVWENDNMIPDGDLSWMVICGYPESGEWQTQWFTREAGPQVSILAGWDSERTEHEDFGLTLEREADGSWGVVSYDDSREDIHAWLFEDHVLFCQKVMNIAEGVCEEAPNRDAASFDPQELRAMEENIVPYVEE